MKIIDKVYFNFLNYANICGQEEIILLPKTIENFDKAKVNISRNILQDDSVTCDIT